jgi:DNA-binding CsgD family transcriptional regulator
VRRAVGADLLWTAADWIRLAILTVTPRAQVTGANLAATKLLAARDPLRTTTDGLTAHVPSETRVLRDAIARPLASQHTLLLSAAASERSVPAVVASAGEQGSIIYIADPREKIAPNPEALTRLYGLTRTEAQFAVALARGMSVEDAAEALAVAPSTARTHLKRIFLKTETNRQAQLVSVLLSLPDAQLRLR